MTEAEREALIHQINRYMHLSSHQMDAVRGALHHLKWEPKMAVLVSSRTERCPGCRCNWCWTKPAPVNGSQDLVRCIECKRTFTLVYEGGEALTKEDIADMGNDMADTQTETPARCEPPEGTESGTFHILGSDYIRAVFLWSNNRWFGAADDKPHPPTKMARLGWRYSRAVPMEPPVPDPHAALRDAVVEAAIKYAPDRLSARGDDLCRAVDALRAAQTPPDPAKELADAMAAVKMLLPVNVAARLETAIRAEIAALNRGIAA